MKSGVKHLEKVLKSNVDTVKQASKVADRAFEAAKAATRAAEEAAERGGKEFVKRKFMMKTQYDVE